MKIEVFKNDMFGEVRTIRKDDEIWFVGKEIAETLGYSNTRDALLRHVDEEDKAKVVIHDGSQNRNMIIINESGLYSLAILSKLPKAKQFKRWVTSELLPAIRKMIKKEVFEMFSKDTQKEAMGKLQEHAEIDSKIYTIANKMVNAIVSEIWGFEKPISKEEMPEDMLIQRQTILDEWIGAYRFSLSKAHANHTIRLKYNLNQVGKYKKFK